MVARLQRFITLGLLALALLWGVLAWCAGHVVWALSGAMVIALGYALALAFEFLLMRMAHGDDPTPRATAAQLLSAWWGELWSAPLVFCWRQPFRSKRWPDHLPREAQGRRGVLLVHGFFCNRGVWNLWLERLHARGVPCIAINLEPVFGAIDDYVGIIDAAIGRLERASGLPPLIVAHSMGGLAVRRWLIEGGNGARVLHVFTVATPHHGTWLARFALTANCRQMQQGSAWLRALAAREPPLQYVRLTCFYSHCDNIVFPPSTATLTGADNRFLPGTAHVHMVSRPEPWQAVLTMLD
jgi:triacylglycerol lipase